MTTTSSYGTWCNQVDRYATGPESDILAYINGGDSDWRKRVETSGAYEAMVRAYRDAIDKALPADISLCGEEFIGPWKPAPGEFDGYPTDENGQLDFKAMIETIDLGAIIEAHDPDLQPSLES